MIDSRLNASVINEDDRPYKAGLQCFMTFAHLLFFVFKLMNQSYDLFASQLLLKGTLSCVISRTFHNSRAFRDHRFSNIVMTFKLFELFVS